jgi:hypothetical protein
MVQVITKSLTELAEKINGCQDVLETHAANMINKARQMGDYLIAAKLEVDHGQWEAWTSKHITRVGQRQIQQYMKLAKHWPEIESKAQSTALLTVDEAIKSVKNTAKTNNKPPKVTPTSGKSELEYEDVSDEPEYPDDWDAEEPPDEPEPADQFKLAKAAAKSYGENFMRSVDAVCRIKNQPDHTEAIDEIASALTRLGRWK